MLYLVAYDIPDDARRSRVSRILLDHGKRVQRSVFECLLDTDDKVKTLIQRLTEVVIEDEDAIRVIPACAECSRKLVILGRGEPTTDPDVYII